MHISDLQRKLQNIYDLYGDIEVTVQNGENNHIYPGQREISTVVADRSYNISYPNEVVIIS